MTREAAPSPPFLNFLFLVNAPYDERQSKLRGGFSKLNIFRWASAGAMQSSLAERIDKRQATASSLESTGGGVLETLFAVLAALELELVIRPRTKSTTEQLVDIF